MIIYDQIKHDITQSYYTENYPNDGQRFVAWYLRNIHGLDPAEAANCITDGADDKQIDAVYISEQDECIYIIQGKFYSAESIDAQPLREVISSWHYINNLQALQENANDKLKAKIAEISSAIDDGYDICFELTTTAKQITEAAQHDLSLFQSQLSESQSLNANIIVVDNDMLSAKYDEALNKSKSRIDYTFTLEPSKYMQLVIGNTRAVIAAVPLKECLNIPGIKDGSLFRKNVRQSLGSGNKVNKDIARTLRTNPAEFFFMHNGITAICSSFSISEEGSKLSVKDINVVNGCQSLNTMYNCSEAVKHSSDGYVMFRFYEIADASRGDLISTSTNSQTAVKARDLRSNDKYVLALKKAYEQHFTDGYFITKRGEAVNTAVYKPAYTVDLSLLGKLLIAWHSQRPTISYSESKIFDKYFEQLFHRSYTPEKVQALNEIFRAVYENWKPENPLGFNEALLAMKAYAPYHHFFAVSILFCELNDMPDSVPDPEEALRLMKSGGLFENVIKLAGKCLNMAFKSASQHSQRVFSAVNWVKSKASLADIREAVTHTIGFMEMTSEGEQTSAMLKNGLHMSREKFSARWTAD